MADHRIAVGVGSVFLFILFWWGEAYAAVWKESGWQQIPVPSTSFVDRDGIVRSPSCSGGPVLVDGELQPADTSFSYFLRKADPRKLLIGLAGGGACWDSNTCIGSAVVGEPVYSLAVDTTAADLEAAGGVAETSAADNPFREFTQVIVPYCTGDVGWGSADTDYRFEWPPGSGKEISWTIRHRGFDNIVAVLDSLASTYADAGMAPDTVVLAGGSAGGYGVLLTLPELTDRLPRRARTFLLSDSANGIVTEGFYDAALGGYALSGGNWGVEKNLPDFLLGAFAGGPDALAVSVYTSLALRYPLTRFGQYTRAWDGIQVFYYAVMSYAESPDLWRNPRKLVIRALEWTVKAREQMELAAQAPNYRFYIGAGTDHTLLLDDSFYTEDSAEDLRFTDWLDDMVNRSLRADGSDQGDWRNVSCAPNCLSTDDLFR